MTTHRIKFKKKSKSQVSCRRRINNMRTWRKWKVKKDKYASSAVVWRQMYNIKNQLKSCMLPARFGVPSFFNSLAISKVTKIQVSAFGEFRLSALWRHQKYHGMGHLAQVITYFSMRIVTNTSENIVKRSQVFICSSINSVIIY